MIMPRVTDRKNKRVRWRGLERVGGFGSGFSRGFALDTQGTQQRGRFCERSRALRRPYYLHAIECLGPHRCMFESNFPVEKESVSYHVLYNAFKKIAADFSDTEKDDLFQRTAVRAYRLSDQAPDCGRATLGAHSILKGPLQSPSPSDTPKPPTWGWK